MIPIINPRNQPVKEKNGNTANSIFSFTEVTRGL